MVESEEKLICTNSTCASSCIKIGNIYSFLENSTSDDVKLSIDKWDEFYNEKNKSDYESHYKIYLQDNFDNVFNQISDYIRFDKNTVFLEIGCGPMYFARAVAAKCKTVVGIDFSLPALKTAQTMLDTHGITNYLLIHCDINKMALKNECVDIIYGGGVIEHFKDTFTAIKECARALKKDGICFNTVPMLNLGSLTYRQIWGNIPNFPVLRQIAEFVHIKLLKGKYMIFGYEFSFLPSTLKNLHKKARFKQVEVKEFPTKLMFEYIPIKPLRQFLIKLATSSPLFWPMVKVVARK